MRRWAERLIASAMIACLPLPAGAQDIPASAATKLQPTGKWVIEYADWQCVLNRQFSIPGNKRFFSLALEPLKQTAWMKFALEADRIERGDGDATMVADGQRRPGTLHYNIYSSGDYQIREYMLDLSKHALGSVRDKIRFWTPHHGDLEIDVNGFQSAWAGLQACMADLYKGFGIDQAGLASIATQPEGSWFTFVDTPDADYVHFVTLFWINADGRVDDCRMLKASGHDKFDRTFCTTLRAKGKFKPARDAAGRALRVPVFDNVQLRREVTYSTEPLDSK